MTEGGRALLNTWLSELISRIEQAVECFVYCRLRQSGHSGGLWLLAFCRTNGEFWLLKERGIPFFPTALLGAYLFRL